MFTGSAGCQGIGLVTNIILARLLVPSDFGAVALVLAVIGILQTFAEMGTSVALVQRQNVTQSVVDSAFALTALVTITIVIIIWLASNKIAIFFDVPVLANLLKIAAFSYLFAGIFSLYRCLLLKKLRYKAISILGFVGVLFHGGISVFLAFNGWGPYSIVWGQVGSTIVLLILGLYHTRYVPRSTGSIKEMWELFSFGVWVSIGRILGNASGKIDVFLIGKLLSTIPLGAYYLAQKMVMLLPATYAGIIDQVMLPIYSQWQDDPSRVEAGYWKVLSYTALIIIPPVCLIFVLADPLVKLVLGEKWIQVIPLVKVMSIFALSHALGGGIFASVIYALGRPQIATIVNVFRMIALPTCVIIGSRWGVLGVAWGFAAYGVVGRFFNQWLLKKYFGFSFFRYFREIGPTFATGFFASGVMLGILSILDIQTVSSQIISVVAVSILWCIIYYIIIRIHSPEESKFLLNTLFQLTTKFRKKFCHNT